MPSVQSITITDTNVVEPKVLVSSHETYPDFPSGSLPPQLPRAVIRPESGGLKFTVTVTGIPSELVGKNLRLETDKDSFYYTSQQDVVGAETTEFPVQEFFTAHPRNPWVLSSRTRFYLCVEQERVDVGTSPVELYILGHKLPTYFKDGVPLLLFRMFVGAAQQQQITTQEQWISLVVRICHGSAEPHSGDPTDTEKHWLKYNTVSGAPSFIQPNTADNDAVRGLWQYNNYGGRFLLSAWLDAYRNFRSRGTMTLVNCYDQAGAVEVAASLGINCDSMAWEYHENFGYITSEAKLVGWGHCNHPYFHKLPNLKVLSTSDAQRKPFSNHAFLSWHPDFHVSAQLCRDVVDPSAYADLKLFAIDACAGPHLGGEERGVWTSPLDRVNDPPKTYWEARDRSIPDNEATKTLNNDTNRHFWTTGITALSDAPTDMEFVSPVRLTISFPEASNLPGNGLTFGDSVETLQRLFQKGLVGQFTESEGWQSVPIADVPIVPNGKTYEMKLCSPSSVFDYVSFKSSVFSSLADALVAMKARAEQVVVTSTITADDLSTAYTGETYTITADYLSLVLYRNLVLEIGGYADPTMISYMTKYLHDNLAA